MQPDYTIRGIFFDIERVRLFLALRPTASVGMLWIYSFLQFAVAKPALSLSLPRNGYHQRCFLGTDFSEVPLWKVQHIQVILNIASWPNMGYGLIIRLFPKSPTTSVCSRSDPSIGHRTVGPWHPEDSPIKGIVKEGGTGHSASPERLGKFSTNEKAGGRNQRRNQERHLESE